MRNPFHVGDVIHGFAGGAFGRDSYECRTVEAVGVDWVVTRNANGFAEFIWGTDLPHATDTKCDWGACGAAQE